MEQQQRLVRYARANRKEPTNATRLLWSRLRANQLSTRFRREDPIGPFLADLSCRTHRLDIECDGDSHIDPDRDCARDQWFINNGWHGLRFSNNEIAEDLEDVVETIYTALTDPTGTVDLLDEGKEHRWCVGAHYPPM